ncbi:E3 ubiquitin-protein ligase rnf8 [Diretmus argenteus]
MSEKRTPSAEEEAWCLIRVGGNSAWLRLFDNTEITIGRGLDVTYQLLSPSCPLMISRLHCVFKQVEDGEWTVTDKKSLNGVWVNRKRIPAEKAHPLRLGDSIQLGVPITGTEVEYEYIFVRRSLRDIKPYLMKAQSEDACAAVTSRKTKRKFNNDEVEPSTSFKPKFYRYSSSGKSFAQPCPPAQHQWMPMSIPNRPEGTGPSVQVQEAELPSDTSSTPSDLDLQLYSQNILMLWERVDDTQRQVASMEAPQQGDPLREEQVKEVQSQLKLLRAKMHRMETLAKSFNETKKQLEAQKTQLQEELLEKNFEEALQEQKKVMEELALSRQGFEEILLAKNKELEVSQEEKEKAKAQKEEVVTQVTEVLENELQCIICSELFIEAVTLNCAHSYCLHCIKEWRKRKDECPICRQVIHSQTRCLALDNCIDSMVDNLSLDMKARRQTLVTERKAVNPAEVVMMIHSDSSSSSSDSMVSIDSTPSSVVSVDTGTDTDSSIHFESSVFHSGTSTSDSDENVDDFEI